MTEFSCYCDGDENSGTVEDNFKEPEESVEETMLSFEPQGWVCPRCNRVNAPFVSQCSCGAIPPYVPAPSYNPPWQPYPPYWTGDPPMWTVYIPPSIGPIHIPSIWVNT